MTHPGVIPVLRQPVEILGAGPTCFGVFESLQITVVIASFINRKEEEKLGKKSNAGIYISVFYAEPLF